jgi:predicted aconitase with swiveling domain
MLGKIRVRRAFGPTVEGVALVSREGFSPRYDLDRTSGLITKIGHALEGRSLKDCILVTPTAKGGVAAGWAFLDLKAKGFAPKALVFGRTNPVMVQGAVFADITITEGWRPDALATVRTGDFVRVDPKARTLQILKRVRYS